MKKKQLIIVESPTKARTLGRFLGDGYTIEASMGHIRDLPQKELGVDIENNFAPTYVTAEKKQNIVRKLRAAAKDSAIVVLATDPDREGEAIAWHIAYIVSKQHKNPKRIVFHQITRSAISEAMKKPRGIDMNLVDAQQGRRVLDRLVGYKLSPLLWSKTGKRWLSAGRVQSVTVRLIVEREREIKAFVSEEYWEIYAVLKGKTQNSKLKISAKKPKPSESEGKTQAKEFTAKLAKIEGKAAEIKNKKQSDKIIADLTKADYKVSSVATNIQKRRAAPPFITSTLQRAAATMYGWSARKTMTIAQNLYEKGKITYHRTDSVHLSPEALSMARKNIAKHYGEKYLPEKPNFYKTTSKSAQEAHEAIRPTKITIRNKGIEVSEKLGRDHQKLLDSISKRFLASQMTPQEVERTKVDVMANSKYLLRTRGEKELFDGWKILYRGSMKRNGDAQELPRLTENDSLDLVRLSPEQKFTQPPPRYNEASLIKALEDKGIGRPSTYAPIISTIQARQYVEKDEKRSFMPTELGEAVNDFLVKNFDSVINVAFTANMEDNLDDIAKGDKKWTSVIAEFWKPFEKHLTKTRKAVAKIIIPQKKTGEMCAECGGELVERIGRYGKFLACSKFPKCKYTKPIIIKIDKLCPKCKGDIVIKKTRKGRKFFGCSNYPKCDFASWKKPK